MRNRDDEFSIKLKAAIEFLNDRILQVKNSDMPMPEKTKMINDLVKQKDKLKDVLFSGKRE